MADTNGMLAAAMILDALIGEPDQIWRRIPHPAVLFGRLVGALDAALNNGPSRRLNGVAAVVILLGAAALAAVLIAAIPLGPIPEIVAAAILLAHRSLIDHVTAVADALVGGLDEGRAAVAKIVGRDVTKLDEAGVARAAIESAAENLSDGVVAPAFWFLIGGLPGLAAYKALNTADSMIGYRTEDYRDFGWAAAKLDDLANWIPARLTALLLAIAHASPDAFRLARRDAGLHRSPNAGWPEAAMASILGVALSGPRVYADAPTDDPFVNAEGRRDPGPADIDRAVAALWRGWAALLILAVVAALI